VGGDLHQELHQDLELVLQEDQEVELIDVLQILHQQVEQEINHHNQEIQEHLDLVMQEVILLQQVVQDMDQAEVVEQEQQVVMLSGSGSWKWWNWIRCKTSFWTITTFLFTRTSSRIFCRWRWWCT
jgi:hypothetical protein